ncbi:MAG: tRNA 2-thiouridine(34) synthase MnmA [Oscillospiraceae bacterium]|nr:tRNA 2-thiouridine(34) synthase MnmA [Oscillospiraceae bacterium]
MSGGVDSSVAAYLTRQDGYFCVGTTMRLYRNTDIGLACHKSCCAESDAEDAAAVAFQLDIPFEPLDYSPLFQLQVIQRFVDGYERGQTPNPCLDCNRYVKFDVLLEYALAQGFEYLVTGHYARITRDPDNGRWQLRKAMDPAKDQSYVLYTLSQHQLSHLRLPLGDLTKTQVREIAKKQGLINAEKRESQDICFIPDGDYGAFLERWSGRAYPEGNFLDLDGRTIGTHRGAARYTIGQRRGLNLALGYPVYVVDKDMAANTVTVGPEAALYRRELDAAEAHWLSIPKPEAPLRVQARIRYRQAEKPATVFPLPGRRFSLVFDEPQRAITPGQAVVLYDGDLVLGGGII